jgi:hypothetical protein
MRRLTTSWQICNGPRSNADTEDYSIPESDVSSLLTDVIVPVLDQR